MIIEYYCKIIIYVNNYLWLLVFISDHLNIYLWLLVIIGNHFMIIDDYW